MPDSSISWIRAFLPCDRAQAKCSMLWPCSSRLSLDTALSESSGDGGPWSSRSSGISATPLPMGGGLMVGCGTPLSSSCSESSLTARSMLLLLESLFCRVVARSDVVWLLALVLLRLWFAKLYRYVAR
uniref:(northern house mosquito) hypothetical protein n=1 Tax=Culex pipiens TaxID=7175 RepID=A0A8D8C378_CULPI